MNAREALACLRRLGVAAIDTADAAAALGLSTAAASQTLARLARAGLVSSVRHGSWWLDGEIDPLRLPEVLTAPLPSYVSLHTALHRRGLIEQIPEVVYAVSLARSQRVETSVGSFSIHHLAPEVFGGFEELESGAKIATPERALFDFAYLSSGRAPVHRAAGARVTASLPAQGALPPHADRAKAGRAARSCALILGYVVCIDPVARLCATRHQLPRIDAWRPTIARSESPTTLEGLRSLVSAL